MPVADITFPQEGQPSASPLVVRWIWSSPPFPPVAFLGLLLGALAGPQGILSGILQHIVNLLNQILVKGPGSSARADHCPHPTRVRGQ